MEQIRAIVLRAAGINCDVETEYALQLAGAQAERVHINRIIEDKNALEKFQVIVKYIEHGPASVEKNHGTSCR